MKNKVVIIGGGASGLLAAITAARLGASVSIMEQMDRIGKKLLSTGNGRCNLTNLEQKMNYYRSENPKFPTRALNRFGVGETLEFFQSIGIHPKYRNGYVYPNSDQAASIVEALQMEAEHLGVEICYRSRVINVIKQEKQGFIVGISTETGNQKISCQKIILATGSKAAPVTGSDGSGYTLAKSLGHSLIKPLPALVPLKGEGKFFKQLAGIRTEVKLRLVIDEDDGIEEMGELQLTDYGISGIPVFQISRYASKALDMKRKVFIYIDFLPQIASKDIREFMELRVKENGYKSCASFLIGLFHKKLGMVLLEQSKISLRGRVEDISNNDISNLCKNIKAFPILITGTRPFEQAQICCGGVSTKEIEEETMESKFIKDLYITGELLDIDGICGGYNLQWAWTSGYIAGYHATMGNG